MTDYKITNKNTKQTQIMNGKQAADFKKINYKNNYDIQAITSKKDKIIFNFVAVCLMTALYLALCELLNTI
jgi:hypothetical protein|tara:strand:- start:1160 stop:1372 length:213 start_codon:yes stop_codon:yes gene_type:complete